MIRLVILTCIFYSSLLIYPQTSPDYIFGDDNGSNWSWSTGTQGTSDRGSSYKWTFQANTTGNHYFKLGETVSNSDGQGFWMNNAAPNLQYTGGGAVWDAYYYGNMGANGAIYFQITNGKYYMIKSRKDPNNNNANFSIQELSSSPVTITSLTDNYRSAGTSMNVYITLSGDKSPEEKLFVRYTTDNWASSALTAEATGSGTAYTATIPAAGVTGTANNKYYAFTTTLSNPTVSEADLAAINYNDNSGNYNQVFEKSITFQINSWQSQIRGPVMWSFKWSDRSQKKCGFYPCGDPEWATVQAYQIMEYNTIGGTNGNSCDCIEYTGSGAVTTSSALAEETNLLNSTSGVTIYFGTGFLSGFQSRCPDGDRRIYTGIECRVKLDGVNKLVFNSYRLDIDVNYNTNSITSTGWGTIDAANSDPVWVREFDLYGTGEVIFEASSTSAIVQECYGSYNVSLIMKAVETNSIQSSGTVSVQGQGINETVNLTNSDVSFNFTEASFGGNGNANGVYANQIFSSPGGTLPSGIEVISNVYWDLSTTLDTFTSSITFDLADIGGMNNTANLRILRRANSSSEWETWSNYTLVDDTHLRANNVTSLSEWVIGSTGDNPFPVELTTFSNSVQGRNVLLKWETQTEVNSFMFEIERRLSGISVQDVWIKVGEVNAFGNSNSPKNYSFTDKGLNTGKYEYRLKAVDSDGSFSYSHSVFADILVPVHFSLEQNYPNPFNPSTAIEFSLPEISWVNLDIYNISGEKIYTLINGYRDAGYHTAKFSPAELASGIYFYRICTFNSAGLKYANAKKMILKK